MSGSNWAREAQNMSSHAPTNSRISLMRSHRSSGLRVVRSLSRGRLLNSEEAGGRAGLVSAVISALLYGPRIRDLVDQGPVALEAVRFAPDEEDIEGVGGGIDHRRLVHPDHRPARSHSGGAVRDDVVGDLVPMEPTR